MSDAIRGEVENGRRARVELPFYSGEVGVRERGDTLELAWFGRPPTFGGPVDGLLDGSPIRVTELRTREVATGASLRQRGSPQRAIIATAERVDPATS